MARGKATYRKRDLRIAREVARPGDNVEARPDGTIVIVTGKSGEADEANGAANPWDGVLNGATDEKRAS
jgi:hypothetical protein